MSRQFNVRNAFYLGGILREPGDVVDIDEDTFGTLSPKDVLGEVVSSKQNDLQEDEVDGLKHLGGGYYELPNGEKVRGKEKALEALKEGDPGAKAQTSDTAGDGASDAESDQGPAKD